jgi:hypothetical protein
MATHSHRTWSASAPPAGGIAFDRIEHGERVVEAQGEYGAPGYRQRDRDLCPHQVGRELTLPADQREQIACFEERLCAVFHEANGIVGCAGRNRMPDGVGPLTLRRIPLPRATMQFGDFLGVPGLQPALEILGHEPVIAEPVSFEVQGLQQQLTRDDRVQHDLTPLETGEGLTERRAQTIE